MTVAEPSRRWYGGFDRLDEVAGAFERALAAPPDNGLRDLPGVPLFSITPEDRRQVTLRRLVDDPRRGHVGGRIHPHVERRVRRVGEPTLGTIDLHRGDAEVEQDRIGLYAVLCELVEDNREVAAQEPRLD